MPRPFAASITVAPFLTSVSLPSIVSLGMKCPLCRLPLGDAGRGGISGNRHHAALVVDVILEFTAKVLDEALHRQRRCVAQRADGAPGDVVGDVREEVEILGSSHPVPSGQGVHWKQDSSK